MKPCELSLEQQFKLRSFEDQARRMSHEQAIEFLIKLHEIMVAREVMYRHMLKESWGLSMGVAGGVDADE